MTENNKLPTAFGNPPPDPNRYQQMQADTSKLAAKQAKEKKRVSLTFLGTSSEAFKSIVEASNEDDSPFLQMPKPPTIPPPQDRPPTPPPQRIDPPQVGQDLSPKRKSFEAVVDKYCPEARQAKDPMEALQDFDEGYLCIICGEVEDEESDIAMIRCDAEDRDVLCCFGWFHLACTGLTRLPPQNKDWICGICATENKDAMQFRGKITEKGRQIAKSGNVKYQEWEDDEDSVAACEFVEDKEPAADKNNAELQTEATKVADGMPSTSGNDNQSPTAEGTSQVGNVETVDKEEASETPETESNPPTTEKQNRVDDVDEDDPPVCKECEQPGCDDHALIMCHTTDSQIHYCGKYWHGECIPLKSDLPREAEWICKVCANFQLVHLMRRGLVDANTRKCPKEGLAIVWAKDDDTPSEDDSIPVASSKKKKKPAARKTKRRGSRFYQTSTSTTKASSAAKKSYSSSSSSDEESEFSLSDDDNFSDSQASSATDFDSLEKTSKKKKKGKKKKDKKPPTSSSAVKKKNNADEGKPTKTKYEAMMEKREKSNWGRSVLSMKRATGKKTTAAKAQPESRPKVEVRVAESGSKVVSVGGNRAGKYKVRDSFSHPVSATGQLDAPARARVDRIRAPMERLMNMALPLSRSIDFDPDDPEHQSRAKIEEDFPWVIHGSFCITDQKPNFASGGKQSAPNMHDELKLVIWVGSEQAQEYVGNLFGQQNDGEGIAGVETEIHHDFETYGKFFEPIKRPSKPAAKKKRCSKKEDDDDEDEPQEEEERPQKKRCRGKDDEEDLEEDKRRRRRSRRNK